MTLFLSAQVLHLGIQWTLIQHKYPRTWYGIVLDPWKQSDNRLNTNSSIPLNSTSCSKGLKDQSFQNQPVVLHCWKTNSFKINQGSTWLKDQLHQNQPGFYVLKDQLHQNQPNVSIWWCTESFKIKHNQPIDFDGFGTVRVKPSQIPEEHSPSSCLY